MIFTINNNELTNKKDKLIMKLAIATTVMVLMAVQVWAFDPSGSYTFKENGMSGSMVVKELGTEISVKLDTVNSQTNMCDIEAKGERVISSDKNIDASFAVPEGDIKFDVVFTTKGAIIKMTSEEGNGCGMNAYFDGKWSKDKVMAHSDDQTPEGGDARADEYSTGESQSPEVQSREEKVQIEKICRFASTQVYGLYQNAQNKVSSDSSYKNLLPKLKKLKIDGLDNEMLAQGLIDEIYGLYYKNGKLTKKDKKGDIEDGYFRACMNNLIK